MAKAGFYLKVGSLLALASGVFHGRYLKKKRVPGLISVGIKVLSKANRHLYWASLKRQDYAIVRMGPREAKRTSE